jgi:hypothetical protein
MDDICIEVDDGTLGGCVGKRLMVSMLADADIPDSWDESDTVAGDGGSRVLRVTDQSSP